MLSIRTQSNTVEWHESCHHLDKSQMGDRRTISWVVGRWERGQLSALFVTGDNRAWKDIPVLHHCSRDRHKCKGAEKLTVEELRTEVWQRRVRERQTVRQLPIYHHSSSSSAAWEVGLNPQSRHSTRSRSFPPATNELGGMTAGLEDTHADTCQLRAQTITTVQNWVYINHNYLELEYTTKKWATGQKRQLKSPTSIIDNMTHGWYATCHIKLHFWRSYKTKQYENIWNI